MSMPVRGLAVVVVLCALSGCTAEGAPTDVARPVEDVVVGLLAPLSGPDAAIGTEQRRGAELAAEIVNDNHREIALPLAAGTGLPNLRGARIRLSVADTTGTASGAETQLGRLVDDLRPVAVIGGDRDAVAAAASQRAERLSVPFLDAGSSAAYLTEVGLDWYFRTAPSDRILSAAAFSLLARQSAGTVALVRPADGSHADIVSAIRELAAETDVQVAATVRVDAAGKSAAAAASKAVKVGPDAAVVIAGTRDAAVATVRELRERKPKLPVIGLGQGFTDPEFVTKASGSGEGVLRPVAWSADFAARNRAAGSVDELYQRRYGTPMTPVAAGAFTAVLALAAAADNAEATTPEAVRSALRAADLPGGELIMPWVGVHFAEGGQNERAAGVVEQIIDGKAKVVHPTELATTELIWPSSSSAKAG